MHYCPICGFQLETYFGEGIICDCCYNERGYSDDLFWNELNREFGTDLLRIFLPQYFEMPVELHDKEFVDRDKIRDILRAKWCLKNYPSFEDDADTCKYLAREEAKKQLQNINVDLDKFEKLLK
jgi:hypothetical protein